MAADRKDMDFANLSGEQLKLVQQTESSLNNLSNKDIVLVAYTK